MSTTSSNVFRPALEPSETTLWHSPWQDELQFASITQASRERDAKRINRRKLSQRRILGWTAATRSRIIVSFIVGTDGRVHSPFILESAGPAGDQTVLQAVQSWRYRPAMCNGVPTEVEAKIEFLTSTDTAVSLF